MPDAYDGLQSRRQKQTIKVRAVFGPMQHDLGVVIVRLRQEQKRIYQMQIDGVKEQPFVRQSQRQVPTDRG